MSFDAKNSQSELSRRTMLKVASGAAVGLTIGLPLTATACNGKSSETKGGLAPNIWLHIGDDGVVTVTCAKSEMGQGPRTVAAMLVAEELNMDWEKVRVVNADANEEKYGGQSTGGSSATRSQWTKMRQAGAAARTMLIAAAAKEWGVDPSTCVCENGLVKGGGKQLGFGALASKAAALPMVDLGSLQLKPKSEWKVVGKPRGNVEAPNIVVGKAQYGLDVRVPGMKYAVIARCPTFGGRASSFDDSEAKKVPGVVRVEKFGSGVLVVADNSWAALRGRDALKIQWDLGGNVDWDTARIWKELEAQLAPHPAPGAGKVVAANYYSPYLAHATMEPMNCTVHYKGDSCEAWVPTQTPASAQQTIAQATGLSMSQVTVHVTMMGGGFGRRLGADYAREAALASKLINGPVQVFWSREDDMKNDNYRPCHLHSYSGSVDGSGNITSLSAQMISPGRGGGGRGALPPYNIQAPTSGGGGVPVPIPTGAWRSVGEGQVGFPNESFIDELAYAAGMDPVAFRAQNMGNERLKRAMQMAAEKAGWGKKYPKGRGMGIAATSGFGSHCAHVVDLSVAKNGDVTIHKVTSVIDCGLAVNPNGVRAQVEGAFMDGVATTLYAGITIKNGGVEQSSFADYEWTRMAHAPEHEIYIISEGDGPGGVGEPGYPPAPPAIANAIFAATGKRHRKIPIPQSERAW